VIVIISGTHNVQRDSGCESDCTDDREQLIAAEEEEKTK
jgi:hypothetical protein